MGLGPSSQYQHQLDAETARPSHDLFPAVQLPVYAVPYVRSRSPVARRPGAASRTYRRSCNSSWIDTRTAIEGLDRLADAHAAVLKVPVGMHHVRRHLAGRVGRPALDQGQPAQLPRHRLGLEQIFARLEAHFLEIGLRLAHQLASS